MYNKTPLSLRYCIYIFLILAFIILPAALFAIPDCATPDNFDDNSFNTGIWTATNLGAASNGSENETGQQLVDTVTSNGITSWGTTDNSRFIYQDMNPANNFVMTLQVNSIQNANAATGGLMVRSSLASGAQQYTMAAVHNQFEFDFAYRTVDNASDSFSTTGAWGSWTFPLYVELVKTGSSIGAYYSTNGTTWVQQGVTQTANFSGHMYVGIETCSDYNGAGTTRVDNFNIACVIGPSPTATGVQNQANSDANTTNAVGLIIISPTPSVSRTYTSSPTFTRTLSATLTSTLTPSLTWTLTPTLTWTLTQTLTWTLTYTPTPPVVIQLTKTIDKHIFSLGDQVNYCLVYTNNGTATASFTLWDTIPAVTDFVSCTNGCSQVTIGPNKLVVWNITNVGVGASSQVCFVVQINRLPSLPWRREFFAMLDEREKYMEMRQKISDADRPANN
jgi:uncharacterized repeat protein (TIGR01451 family)